MIHCLVRLLYVAMLVFISTEYAPAQSNEGAQSVSLANVNAQVSIDYTPFTKKATVEVRFSTTDRSKENVNCLNAYRDIKYVLRDASGAAAQADPNAWTKRPDTLTEQYSEHPCHELPWTTKDSRAFLETLFPECRAWQVHFVHDLCAARASELSAFSAYIRHAIAISKRNYFAHYGAPFLDELIEVHAN